jgi:hypothetical protein
VREVSLLGSADLTFWKDQLLNEGLVPAEKDGKSQLLVVAAEMKFMGVRFRELSFSVLLRPPLGGHDAVNCRLKAGLQRAIRRNKNGCQCPQVVRCPF